MLFCSIRRFDESQTWLGGSGRHADALRVSFSFRTFQFKLIHRFAGFSNVVLLAPLFPILHYTGIEPFELPKSKAIWVHCIVNMAICVSSDYIYMIGKLLGSP